MVGAVPSGASAPPPPPPNNSECPGGLSVVCSDVACRVAVIIMPHRATNNPVALSCGLRSKQRNGGAIAIPTLHLRRTNAVPPLVHPRISLRNPNMKRPWYGVGTAQVRRRCGVESLQTMRSVALKRLRRICHQRWLEAFWVLRLSGGMLTIIGGRGDATFRAISVGWVGRSARLQSNCPRAYWGTGIIPFACVSFFFSSG